MKALVYKELTYGLRYFWIFSLFSVLAFVSTLVGGPIQLGVMSSLMFGLLGNSIYAYEEKSHFNAYISAMPFSDIQVVSAKYLVNIAITVVNALFITLGTVLNVLAVEKLGFDPEKFNAQNPIMIPTALMVYLIVGLAWNIVLPIAYRFGSERSRWVFCVLGGISGAMIPISMDLAELDIPTIMDNLLLILGIALGVIVLLVAGSWWLSVKVYKKRAL